MVERDDVGPADRDREVAETIETSGMQNAVAVGGLGVLLLIPVAWMLTALGRLLRRLVRAR
jgi:hypothetical protein